MLDSHQATQNMCNMFHLHVLNFLCVSFLPDVYDEFKIATTNNIFVFLVLVLIHHWTHQCTKFLKFVIIEKPIMAHYQTYVTSLLQTATHSTQRRHSPTDISEFTICNKPIFSYAIKSMRHTACYKARLQDINHCRPVNSKLQLSQIILSTNLTSFSIDLFLFIYNK